MHAAFPLIHPPLQQAQPGATGTPGQPAMVSTVPGTTPLVFDSPHSGTHYPADFRSACSLPTLRRAEVGNDVATVVAIGLEAYAGGGD